MSSSSDPQHAPWADLFTTHLSKMSSPEFVLATLDADAHIPRARYCIYRGLWAALPENKHNEAPKNPRAWLSDCPTFTTDARMQKPRQLTASGSAATAGGRRADGGGMMADEGGESGGGGPVEAVWWIKENGIMAQWRVKGSAWVLGRDIDSDVSGAKRARAAIEKRMRRGEEHGQPWSWAREVTAHFGGVSPGMRGTFKNPPPGTPKKPGDEPDKEHQLAQKIDDLHDPIARANFRVVVILPDEVERVELADPEKAHRMRYSFDEQAGSWSEAELWP